MYKPYDGDNDYIRCVADVVGAYVGNNSVSVDQLPELIGQVHAALRNGAIAPITPQPELLKPAVAVKKSVTPDYLICLEDGLKFKSMKRHLRVKYGLSPEEYRAKWGLPHDYPMVAPSYAKTRSNLARQMRFGHLQMESRSLVSRDDDSNPNEPKRRTGA